MQMMGFFMVGIPAAGFIAGIICLCVAYLRFLAPFAFLMPVIASYAAIFGFAGGAVGLEKLGASEAYSAIGGLVCLFFAGLLGAWAAYFLQKI